MPPYMVVVIGAFMTFAALATAFVLSRKKAVTIGQVVDSIRAKPPQGGNGKRIARDKQIDLMADHILNMGGMSTDEFSLELMKAVAVVRFAATHDPPDGVDRADADVAKLVKCCKRVAAAIPDPDLPEGGK